VRYGRTRLADVPIKPSAFKRDEASNE